MINFWKRTTVREKKSSRLRLIFELDFFSKFLKIDKSEKERIAKFVQKRQIADFLFYTDVRNGPSILLNGIKVVSELNLNENEEFYVWSYLQHDLSIGLELDSSTRGNFWKWMNDLDLDVQKIMVIGINPSLLTENTQKDWVWDRVLNVIDIPESIPLETIKWIMVRDEASYYNLNSLILESGLDIEIFYGKDGIVRREKKKIKEL